MAAVPPLRALAVFEAAARCGTFKQAARELNITTSAVSHQIRILEKFVDRQLFFRMNRGVRLTMEGAAYFETIRDAYSLIENGTRKLLDKPVVETLTVHCGVSFGLRWLTPRIPTFLAEHPQIDLRISTPTGHLGVRQPPNDVEIRYGVRELPGMRVEPLFEEAIVPLCSPALLEGDPKLRNISDLAHFRLIDSDISAVSWSQFLAEHDITLPNSSRLKFNNVLLALQAATSGLGIALEGEFLAGEELSAGRLIVPPALKDFRVQKPLRSFVVSKAKAQSRKVIVFRKWLFDTMSLDLSKSIS